jgi:predicted RNA-binding protein
LNYDDLKRNASRGYVESPTAGLTDNESTFLASKSSSGDKKSIKTKQQNNKTKKWHMATGVFETSVPLRPVFILAPRGEI